MAEEYVVYWSRAASLNVPKRVGQTADRGQTANRARENACSLPRVWDCNVKMIAKGRRWPVGGDGRAGPQAEVRSVQPRVASDRRTGDPILRRDGSSEQVTSELCERFARLARQTLPLASSTIVFV